MPEWNRGVGGGIRAKVINGRLIVDQPTLLPEGTFFDLVIDVDGGDLDPADRRALHAARAPSIQDIREGRVVLPEDLLRDLWRHNRL